ncbi:hypothetical protein AB0G42_15715 [Streptomyces yangpuensis]
MAPVVGTVRVMSAAGHIVRAFGVALAESDGSGMAQAEAASRTTP